MKFINHKEINSFVSGYYIDSFDITNKKSDYDLLLKIIRSLYKTEDDIFIICQLSPYEAQEEETIKSMTEHLKGQYAQLPPLANDTSKRFFIHLRFSKDSSNFILKLWKKLEFLLFFKPSTDLDWNTFITYEHNVFDFDQEAIKMFSFNFTDFVCIKGAAGESLIINYKNAYQLPNLSLIIK